MRVRRHPIDEDLHVEERMDDAGAVTHVARIRVRSLEDAPAALEQARADLEKYPHEVRDVEIVVETPADPALAWLRLKESERPLSVAPRSVREELDYLLLGKGKA